MLPKIDAPQYREYIEDPARLRQGGVVELCVQRFVDYEFEPPEGKGVGRGRGVVVTPLAEQLDKSLTGVDALAIGYMSLALHQARVNRRLRSREETSALCGLGGVERCYERLGGLGG